MDGVATMNLSDSTDAMTPLFSQPIATPPAPSQVYNASIPPPNAPEKNMGTLQMDSTPIADIMGSEVDYQMAPPQMQQVYTTPQVAQQKKTSSSGNPFNMTNEQLEALLAGVVALVAFSGPVQEKLTGMIPQMLSAAGERSNTGLIVTALVAAILFYFGRRFVVKG